MKIKKSDLLNKKEKNFIEVEQGSNKIKINDLLSNKEILLNEMDRFRTSFDELYFKIKDGDRDGMRQMMRCSTERRKLFDKI